MRSKLKLAVTGATLFALTATGAFAAADATQVISKRQETLKTIGKNFKAIRDELDKSTPDKALIAADAKTIASLFVDLPSWFPVGSGPEAGIKTAAKPEIWAQFPTFKQDADAAVVQIQKLADVTAGGDLAAIGAQVKATAGACGTCHKPFRVKDDDAPGKG